VELRDRSGETVSDWLTTLEACRRARCSRWTLLRAVRRGELQPDGGLGRQARWKPETIDEWIARGRAARVDAS
jgi:excisionase family DNA binding protein